MIACFNSSSKPLFGWLILLLSRNLLPQTTVNAFTENSCASSDDHTFYILRHGQTDANKNGLIQGSSDFSRLTDLGKEQATEVFEEVIQDLSIDSIYVSPLTRARETLQVMMQQNTEKKSLPSPVVLETMREIDFYDWESKDKEYLKSRYPTAWKAWEDGDPFGLVVESSTTSTTSTRNDDQDKQSTTRKYPLLELWKRAPQVWQTIRAAQRSSGARSTLLVAHGSLGQALLGTAMGWDATHFREHEFPNCGMVQIQWNSSQQLAYKWRWIWPNRTEWFHREEL